MNALSTAVATRVQRNLQADAPLATELVTQLKRVSFLLSSSRLIMLDNEARTIAGNAVREAQATIARAEA